MSKKVTADRGVILRTIKTLISNNNAFGAKKIH